MLPHPRNKKGFSLIEAAIVLGVVGAVIGTIWVAAAAMYESYKVNKTVEDILFVVRTVQNKISISDLHGIVANAGTYHAHLPINFVIDYSLYPKDWIKNNSILHRFGGSSNLHLYDHDGTYPERFDFTLYELPDRICIKLAVAISSRIALSKTSDWSSIGYITNGNSSPKFTLNNFPITPEAAETMCNMGGSLNTFRVDASLTRIN